jgi:hypothetical protein
MILILQLKLMFQAAIFYNMLSLSSLLSEYEVNKTYIMIRCIFPNQIKNIMDN